MGTPQQDKKKFSLASMRAAALPGGSMGIGVLVSLTGVWAGVLSVAPMMMFAWYVIYVPTWAAERKYASEIKMGATKSEALKQARRVHDHLAFWRRNPPTDADPPSRE